MVPKNHVLAFVYRRRQTDVAPLVARLLGLPFVAPDGRLHEELLEPTFATAAEN